jgi:hypothetical protein
MPARRGALRRVRMAATAVAALVIVGGCRPGTPDDSFGDGGTAVLAGAPAGDDVSAAPAADGGTVVARGRDGGELVELASAGSVVVGWGGATPVACAERDELDRHRDGYLLACTSTAEDGARVTHVLRYTDAGRPDPRFGTGGVVALAGEVEGVAAVPLPRGRILVLGGRPPRTGEPPVLVTTVLDRRGRLVSSTDEELTLPEWPPDQGLGADVTVVAEPTRRGAVAAIHPGLVLPSADWLRPSDPFLVVFDGSGTPVRRMEGPAYPDRTGDSTIIALAELPRGRVAALEERWILADSPRPTADYSWPIHIYAADGTEVGTVEPARPATAEDPQVRDLAATTLMASAGGRHLLVGGTYSPQEYETNGAVLRYDTATWSVDRTFGAGGLADLGSHLVVRDLDPRGDDPTRLDATARVTPLEVDPTTPAIVVRLWNSPPRRLHP